MKTKEEHPRDNPFLTDKAEDLWKQLDKGGKPVAKEELLKRAKDLKTKGHS